MPRRQLGLERLEDRLLFTVFTVTGLGDGPLELLRGNGTLELREAIELATNLDKNVDGYVNKSTPAGTFTGTDPALINTIQFAASLDGKTLDVLGGLDVAAGYSAFGIKNGARLTIDGQTGMSKGITIARPNEITVPGTNLTALAPSYRLANIYPSSALTLKGLSVFNFGTIGGAGGVGIGAGGGGGAGLGGAIFNQGTLNVVNSTMAYNYAVGGNGGNRGIRDYMSDGGGSGGGGLASPGEGGGETVGGGGGQPNSGDGGGAGTNGLAGGFGGGGGGGGKTAVILQFIGRGGDGGFGGGGGGGASDGTGVINVDYRGERGGNGGFGGGGGAAGHGAQGVDVNGRGGFGGGDAGEEGSGGAGGGAGMGGAIFNNGGTVTVSNSTFYLNFAAGGSGGLGVGGNGEAGKGLGGVIFSRNGTVSLSNATLSFNGANEGGRGVFLYGNDGTVYAKINNTLIGHGDTADSDLEVALSAVGAVDLVGTNNLIRTTNTPTGPNDNYLNALTGDPLLGPLQNNGGLVPTMKPDAASPVYGLNIGAYPVGQPQTVTFAALANKTYGDADFALSATSSSRLPVSFTASGNATVRLVDGVWYARITGAGAATITAVQAGNDTYAAAPSVSQSFTIAKAASVTTTVGAGPFTYTATAQAGGSGTVTGAGGLNTAATSVTYSANANGTGVADRTNVGTYYVTAHYAGDANHLASDGAAVAIAIVAKHITGAFTAADKVYDGTRTATVTARSLVGVIGNDAVSLTGGTATFATKNAGTQTVTLVGASITGAASANYVLDSVATTTASILRKTLGGSTTTQNQLNIAKAGALSFQINLNRSGVVDGQSTAGLFNGASFSLKVGGRTYGVTTKAVVANGIITVDVAMTAALKSILAASTTATNGGKATAVVFTLEALSIDGNYALSTSVSSKLFNTGK